MKIKIVLWNILNGFCKDKVPYTLDKKRLQGAIKILNHEKPDILVLCEAYFWPFAKQDELKEFKKIFSGMYEGYAPATDSMFRWGPVVLSKFPVEDFDFSLGYKDFKFLRTKIKIKNKQICFDTYHPHPSLSEEDKTEFLRKFLETKEPPYILAGDFNAVSPQDAYDKDKLIKGFKGFMGDKGAKTVENFMQAKVVGDILAEGLIDTYRKKHSAMYPTVGLPMWKNENTAMRIDYIFCSKEFKVIDAGVISNKITQYASDHYPIYAVLEI